MSVIGDASRKAGQRLEWNAHTGRRAAARNLRRLERGRERMGKNNGHGHLAMMPHVPIVGVLVAIEDWNVHLYVTCKCDAPQRVSLFGKVGSAFGQCPSCGAILSLAKIAVDAAGAVQFAIKKLTPQLEGAVGGAGTDESPKD